MMSSRLAYPPAELAQLVGRSRRTVWAWIKAGKVRCVNGLVPAEDVRELLGLEPTKPRDELDRQADALLREVGVS